MACRMCTPELLTLHAGAKRAHPQHHAIRFGDWALQVYKDGEEIKDAYEVDTLDGTALRIVQPTTPCECEATATAYLDHGNFTVQHRLS